MRLELPAGWRPHFGAAALLTVVLLSAAFLHWHLTRCPAIPQTEIERVIAAATQTSLEFFLTNARPPQLHDATRIFREDDCRVVVGLGFRVQTKAGARGVFRTQTTFAVEDDSNRLRAIATIAHSPFTVTLP